MPSTMFNRIILICSIFLTINFSSQACDGMSVNVISNVDLGDGTYQVTIQYCENVTNGAGTAVYGILLDVNGANIISTSTPSFTSNSTGITINYNVIDANTSQWGEWDNNPSAPIFLNDGGPNQCFTIVIITDAPATSVSVAGSSAASNLGGGFVNYNGRYTCRITKNVPAPPCTPVTPTFNPIAPVCQNSALILPTTSTNGQTGTWAPVVNTSTVGTTNYTFTASGGGCVGSTVLPITVVASGTPTFNPIPSVCLGATAPVLPTTSTNGVTGTWSSAVSTAAAGTFNFTFTPTPPSCYNTAQISVTVNPLPNVNAGLDQTVCNGTLVTLSGSGASGYIWNNSVSNNVGFSPPAGATTTYTVTGTDINGCQNTDDVAVTVQNNPIVNAGSDQTICLGSSATLTASGANSFVWSNNGANGQTVSPATTTTYSVIGTTGSCQGNDDITITVNNPTTPTFNPIPSACLGSIAPVLPTTSTNGVTGTWSSTVSTSVPGTFNFTFTPNLACNTTAQISVTINPLPIVDAGNYSSVCRDASPINLVGSPAGGTFTGTGVTGSSFSPAQGSQTVTYTYTDANGCTNTDNQLITIFNLPNISGNDASVCEGQSIILSGSGGVSYVWNNGVINNQPFSPNLGQTNYTVTGTDANGCTNSDNVIVTVSNMPTADIIPDITSGFPGLFVNFMNNSSVTTNYSWNFGNGTTANTNNLNSTSTTYNNPGVYTVVLIATNGICTDYDTVQIIVNEYPEPIIDIPNVFTPNGDSSNDHFFLDATNVASIKYIIVNRWGNLIFEIEGVNPLWEGKTNNGKPVEEGVYFVKYEAIGINGKTYTGHGNVTLIRD